MRSGLHAARGLWLLLALFGLLLSATGPAAAADPTRLDAQAELSGNSRRLAVSGVLRSGDDGVDRAEVHVSIDSTPIGSTTTNRRGSFSLNFTVPEAFASGNHTLTVQFHGNDDYAASQTNVTLSTGGGQDAQRPDDEPDIEPEEPPSTEPPPDTRATATVSLSLDPENPRPGDLMTLEGRVMAAEQPVATVAVQVRIGGLDSPDSLTYTDAEGYFSTFLEVSAELAPGETGVQVMVAESTAHRGGRAAATITVREPVVASEDPTPTPPADEAEPTAEPTPEAAEDTGAAATATAEVTVQAEDDDEGTTAIAPSPWSWFLIALVVVGGSALLVTIALLMRRSTHRGSDDGATDTVFLLGSDDVWGEQEWDHPEADAAPDDDPEATQPDLNRPIPHHGEPVTGTGAEPPTTHEPPPEDPKPRRSLPPED